MLSAVDEIYRTRVGQFIYKRFSFPFVISFKILAYLRSGKTKEYQIGKPADSYLSIHTEEYFREKRLFGYPRVYNLLNNFNSQVDPRTLKLLSLGPRTEIELYYLWLFFGFSWDNLMGLDLVSSSSKIKIGDLSHELPFADSSFDIVVASHCLEKSRDLEKTRDEIIRIVKPGGRVLVCGNRLPDGAQAHGASHLPRIFFENGVYGFIKTYGIQLEDIEYMNARSRDGFQIIFQIKKK